MEGTDLTPENYFLRYAFPCIFMKKIKGEVTPEEITKLEDSAINNKKIEIETLERIFSTASEHMDKLATEKCKEKWSMEIIKEYFLEQHNKIVDKSTTLTGNTLKELCKIREAKIIEDYGKTVKVQYGERLRNVSKEFFPETKPGDSVRIHYAYIVEVL